MQARDVEGKITEIISSLDDYSLTVKMMSRMNVYTQPVTGDILEMSQQNSSTNTAKYTIQTTNEKVKDRFFFPKEPDNLFWCYYIFSNGYHNYEIIDTSKFTIEKEHKISCIDVIRQNKKQLTPFRIKGLKDTVEDDLVNSKKITLKTFIALCIVSNMNVMYVHNRKYYEIKCDPDNKDSVFVIHRFDTPVLRYGYEENVTSDILEKYRAEKYCCHSIDSPLKAVSSYKVGELRDICSLLGIDNSLVEKKTKPQLYQIILETLL